MKLKPLILLIAMIAVCSAILCGCGKKDELKQITYTGRVVDSTNGLPMKDITTRITNGTVVRASMVTQQDGMFSLSVLFSDIDETFYLELLDKNGNSKKGELRAFEMSEYDYGDIPFSSATPVVETVSITSMTETSFSCKCNVVSQGNAPVTEKGLCWGTNIPTIDDHIVRYGSGEGIYICTVNEGINISTTTYYARAYAMNEYGVAYGEAIEINSSKLKYMSLPTVEYGGYTYHIYPDMGGMMWEQGVTACNNLSAYGFGDWYLPNKEEMLAIANSSNQLDKNYSYWSSDAYNGAYAFAIYYRQETWQITSGAGVSKSNIYHIIPVRKDNGDSYYGAPQKITSEADCETCNGWVWNNGVATIGRGDGTSFKYYERSFSFITKRSGDVVLEIKEYDPDYSSWVRLFYNDTSESFQQAKSTDFKKVSLGHVDNSQHVYICGINIIVTNVRIE